MTIIFQEVSESEQFPMEFEYQHMLTFMKGTWVNWHVNIEIIYILSGNCMVFCNSQLFSAKKGDIFICNSTDAHMVYTLNSCCDYLYLIPGINFCKTMQIDVQNLQFCSKINDDFVGSIILDMYEEQKNKNSLYTSHMTGKLIELLVYLCRNHLDTDTPKRKNSQYYQKLETLKAAIRYISANCMRKITLDDLCYELGFNKYYFCHLFKEMTSQTVFSYINSMRCDRARALLATGQYTISEVSDLCGFCSASYFTKQYKKYIGTLPSNSLRNKKKLSLATEG